MTEETRDEKQKKSLLDELLERKGFKRVPCPEDFIRVIVPGIRWNPEFRTDPEEETPGSINEEEPL